MSTQETLTLIAYMLAPAFFSLLGMAALGSPAIAVLGEISAKTRKKVFFDKYGQQTAAMGLILTVAMILICGASLGLAMVKFPDLYVEYITPGTPFFNGLAAIAVFVIAGLLYFSTWKKLRTAKAAHMALGLVATFGAIIGLAIIVPAKLALNFSLTETTGDALTNTAIMAQPMSAMYALLALSAAAAMSLSYLIIRRNKDDFGRDYYNFALRMAARWALLPMIGFLGCQGWLYSRFPTDIQTLILGTPLAYVWTALVCIGAVCCFIWLFLGRSESPLRLKGLAFLTLALFWIMHALNVTLFVNFMTML
jgi:MFS family permease